MNNLIQSQIEVVAIKEFKKNLQNIKTKYFSESELQALRYKHPQTLAGFYAAKMALKKLINQKISKNHITENQIILMHNSNGAPCIKEIASLRKMDLEKISISISHTTENAYGFASIQESVV